MVEHKQNASTEGSISQSSVQNGGGESAKEIETDDIDGCQSALNGNLKTIPMKPRVNEKYDLSLFLHGKRAIVLKNLERA